MGQFSWITQDTDEAIRETLGTQLDEKLTTAYLHDNKGNVWEEKKYQGYGVFGGKDFYELLAEMNDVKVTDEDIQKMLDEGYVNTKEQAYTQLMRGKGIDLYFGDDPFISPNLTRGKNWKWKNEAPEDDPNQGWGSDEDEYDEDDDFLIGDDEEDYI